MRRNWHSNAQLADNMIGEIERQTVSKNNHGTHGKIPI